MPVIPPSSSPARKSVRRWVSLVALTSAATLAFPALGAAADARPVKNVAEFVSPTSAPATAKVAAAPATSLSSSVKVGVYPDSSTWTNNGITSFYLGPNRNGTRFPLAQAEALLAKGVSLDIELHPDGTTYIAGIVSGNATALAWLDAYIANIKTLANYSTLLNNGTYVVAALMHESQAEVRDGGVTGASANYTTIGKAQEIAIQRGKAAAPNAYWSVWLVGYDRTDEGTQLAQITNPKPDLITWDPYENHSCSGTFADIATDDFNWVKAQPAYNGNVALSETGMTATCSDSQLATFYTGITSKLQAISTAFRFAVVFDSNAGAYPHVIQSSKTKAIAALKASLHR